MLSRPRVPASLCYGGSCRANFVNSKSWMNAHFGIFPKVTRIQRDFFELALICLNPGFPGRAGAITAWVLLAGLLAPGYLRR